jgi:serine/threonine protein kinase
MPTKSEAEEFTKYEFIRDDPSQFYDIVKRIGVGGFAKVFEVKRKSDGKAMALKFIEPRNESERSII